MQQAFLKGILLTITSIGLIASCTDSGGGNSGSASNQRSIKLVGNCQFDAAADDTLYDLAIINGRVMDPECNFDGDRNVGIKNGRIATISQGELTGKEVLDATGHVVSPGFIDTQIHATDPFSMRMFALDGVTTALDLEVGVLDVEPYYQELSNQSLLNFGATANYEGARIFVMDGVKHPKGTHANYVLQTRVLSGEDGKLSWAEDIATPEQKIEIEKLLNQSLADGALGIGLPLEYYAKVMTSREVIDIQKLAKKYDRIVGVHTRISAVMSLPAPYTLGAQEVMANAMAIDGALIVMHMANKDWKEVYELCRGASKQGFNIFCEYYPYRAGFPNAGSPTMVPDVIESFGVVIERDVMDPSTGKYITKEELINLRKTDPGRKLAVFINTKEDQEDWISMENVAITNDALPMVMEDGSFPAMDMPLTEYRGHPRSIGSRSRLLAMTRDQNLPLMNAINNASYVPAKYLSKLGLKAMQERGRMQPGTVADITIFNADTVQDNATYTFGEQGLPPTGIPYVIVNGEFIVKDSKVILDAKPGQGIRY